MTTTGRRPPPSTTERTRAEAQAALADAFRSGTDSPTPGPLLTTASTLLSITAGGSDPAAATTSLIRGLAAGNRPEFSAGALAMATLAGDDALCREVRRDSADRGHPLPRWLAQLHRAEPVDRAVELSTVFRAVDELAVGVAVPGGHDLTAVVRVDNEAGSRAVGGYLVEQPVDDVVAQAGGDDVRARGIAPADARARLTSAFRGPDLDALFGRDTPWRQLRPLVSWLITRLPDGGDATVPGTCEDLDLDDVAEAFLASPWGRPWIRGSLPALAEAVLGEGLSNGLGDPLLWAPHNIRRLLDPETLTLDGSFADRVPDLLRDLIRYGHAERGLPTRLTDDALAAVDRSAGPFLAAVRAREDDVA